MGSPYPHYAWAAGHAILLLSTLKYVLNVITFRSGGIGFAYKLSYFGAALSYGIVIYKSFGIPQPNAAWLQRALLDENVQYFILALFWTINKPIPLTLIPYATFSLFHVLTFVRTNLIPLVFPPPPKPAGQQAQNGAAAPTSGGAGPAIQQTIQKWVKSNYDGAMRFVAYAELVVFVRLLLGAIAFQNGILLPVFYALFLRSRYFFSPYTRAAFANIGQRIDGLVASKPSAANIWRQAKAVLNRFAGGAGLQPRPQGQAQEQRAR